MPDPMHNEFHIHIHGPGVGRPDGSPAQPSPIPTSFEAALDRLQKNLPEALVEYDGSFAWAKQVAEENQPSVAQPPGRGPQIHLTGIIYDARGAIQYIELRGKTDQVHFRQLLEVLAGTEKIDDFAVITLPQGEWKDLQTFVRELP